MKCINFDDKFADFMSRWVKEHAGEYRNYDAMEADMPRIYMLFLNTPARWLDGVTPGACCPPSAGAKAPLDRRVADGRRAGPVPAPRGGRAVAAGAPATRRPAARVTPMVSWACSAVAVRPVPMAQTGS